MFKNYFKLLCFVGFVFALQPTDAQNKIKHQKQVTDIQDQKTLENRFDKLLSTKSIGENIKQLSAEPHHLGSPGGKRVADAILNKFKAYGWDASIEVYKVLFPTPKTRILELISPINYVAGLQELPLPEDATSGQAGQLPPYVAWSADGNVTADLVYVNFGLPKDYEQLERLGISVKGKIVIARYGNSWRGIKPKIAYEHGAVGCIIYSDPKEDGYYQGDQYPKGAFKNEYMVQRGSVMDMVVYPGDPLTPGVGATENAKRLSREEAPTILKIPVLPISYHDALPFLSALEGAVAPVEWRGALPIVYKVGGTGKVKVHLKAEFNWDLVPAYDVIAKIKGSAFPDEWIIRGNHHDAWVNGADDPISAQAALLEEAKAIGYLVKSGYKPKRTIVYCAWDGEEQSLLGSTEWVENHAEELKKKAVAYINTDGNSRGFLNAGGSHAFEQFVTDIAKDVKDPQTGVSIFERQRAAKALSAETYKQKKEEISKTTFSLEALGTGSDYSPFFQHVGIPALSFEFGGEGPGGEYHSIFDSYNDYVHFKDPDFSYGVALSQVVGRAVLRLADTSLLPFDYRSLHNAIDSYLVEIKKIAELSKEETLTNNYLISLGSYSLADDPQKKLIPPVLQDSVPDFDFSLLKSALDTLGKLADTLHGLQFNLAGLTDVRKDKVNELLFQAEKSLLIENGLPRRPWYKHSIYAPGFTTGYSVKTLPGIREAIEERHWLEANEQILVATEAIGRLNKSLGLAITLANNIVPTNKSLTQTAQPLVRPVNVLLVTAHPDDEILLAATIYKIKHALGGIVDQVVITNGEGGYSYSLLSEPIYHLKLTTEAIGRENLPEIRKQELLNAGKILGIRNHYFFDQKDTRFGLDIKEPLESNWNVDLVRNLLKEILIKNKYDYVLTLLPDSTTHAHHKAATILALQAVESLVERPVVLAVATANKSEQVKDFFQLPNFPVSKVSKGKFAFHTDRTTGFAPLNQLNYKIIVNWVIAEHKSQGTLQNLANDGDYENFWYFDLNGTAKFEKTKQFFDSLRNKIPD